MSGTALTFPKWMRTWLQVTSFVCFFDAWFIILRPNTFPDGMLGFFFYPYKYYYAVDRMYADVNDSFVYAQSVCNLLEIVLNLVALYLNHQITKQAYVGDAATVSRKAKFLALVVTTMTFWKTVVYFLVYYNMDFRKNNSFLKEFVLVVCTNGIWVVVPFICMAFLFQDLCNVGGIHSGVITTNSEQYKNDASAVGTSMKLRESTVKQRKP